MKSTTTWLILSVIVCCIITGISYHGGLAYDGATTMGFPFTFYRHSVGMNAATQQMEDHITFKWLVMAIDMVLVFVVVFYLLRLYKFLRQ